MSSRIVDGNLLLLSRQCPRAAVEDKYLPLKKVHPNTKEVGMPRDTNLSMVELYLFQSLSAQSSSLD